MHPTLGCHINDTIACDVQIAFDSELPRHRCIGPGPSRRRLRCQTTEQSFGKHWQHPVFSFSAHFLTSSQTSSEVDDVAPLTPPPPKKMKQPMRRIAEVVYTPLKRYCWGGIGNYSKSSKRRVSGRRGVEARSAPRRLSKWLPGDVTCACPDLAERPP